MSEYFAIVTETGKRKMLEAINIGEKIDIVDFAVGDGGGSSYTPSADVTALKNEVWRGKVDTCHISEESENVLIVETVMPSSVGGFTVREMGIFDHEGDLIAVCNVPDTQKVKITDGVVHELNLIMEIALDNVEGVELVVDPCVLMATKKDIENLNEKLNKYIGNPDNADNPNGGIGFNEGIKADNVVDAINEVFLFGNEKKNKLVENLIAMGVSASTDETWAELLNKVLDINNYIYDAFVTAGTTPDDKTLDSLTNAIDKIKKNAYTQGMNAANNANIGSITTCRNGGTVGNNWVCTSKMAILSCNATGNCGASSGEGRGYLKIAVDNIVKASDSAWCNHEEKSLSISGVSFSMTKGQKVSCWGEGSGDAWGSRTGFSATVWLLD